MISLCPHLIHDYFGKVEDIFKVYHPQIVEQVEYQDISDGLTMRGVISPKQHDQIHLIEGNKDQMEKAITTIKRRIWGLENFVMVLMDENLNPWLAEELFQSYTRYLVPHMKKQRSLGKCDCPAESNYLGSLNKRWITMLRKMDSWMFEVGTSIGFLNQTLYPTGSLLSFISDRLPLPEKKSALSGDLELQYKQIMCSPSPTQTFENYRPRSPMTVLEVADKDDLENGFEDDKKETSDATNIPLVRSASMNSIVSIPDTLQNDRPQNSTQGSIVSIPVLTDDEDCRENWSDDFEKPSKPPHMKSNLLDNGYNIKESFSTPNWSVKEIESTNLMKHKKLHQNTNMSNGCENANQHEYFYERSSAISDDNLFLGSSPFEKHKSVEIDTESERYNGYGIHHESKRSLNIHSSDSEYPQSMENTTPECDPTKCMSNQGGFLLESNSAENQFIEGHLLQVEQVQNCSELIHLSEAQTNESPQAESYSKKVGPTNQASIEGNVTESSLTKSQSFLSITNGLIEKFNINQKQQTDGQLVAPTSTKNQSNCSENESDPARNQSTDKETENCLSESDSTLTMTMQLENRVSKSNQNKNQAVEGQLTQPSPTKHLSVEGCSTESDPVINQSIDGHYFSGFDETTKNLSKEIGILESNQTKNSKPDYTEQENMKHFAVESDPTIRQLFENSYSEESDYTKTPSSECQSRELSLIKNHSVKDSIPEVDLTQNQSTKHHLESQLVGSKVNSIKNHITESDQNPSVKISTDKFGQAVVNNGLENHDFMKSNSSENFSKTPKLMKSKFTVENLSAACTKFDLDETKCSENFSEFKLAANDSRQFRTESDPNLFVSFPKGFNAVEDGISTAAKKDKSKSAEFNSTALQSNMTRAKQTDKYNYSEKAGEPKSYSQETFSVDSPYQSNSKLIKPYSEDFNSMEDEVTFNFKNPMQYYNLVSSDQQIILPASKTLNKAHWSSDSNGDRIGRSVSAISNSCTTTSQKVKTSGLTNALDLAIPHENVLDLLTQENEVRSLREDDVFNLESGPQSLEFLNALDTTQASYIPSELEWDWDYDTVELDITSPKIEMADSETQTCNFLSSVTSEEEIEALGNSSKTLFSNSDTGCVNKNHELQEGEHNEIHKFQESNEIHEPQEPNDLHESQEAKRPQEKKLEPSQEIRKSQNIKSRSSSGSVSSLSSVTKPRSSTPLPNPIRTDKSKPLPFSPSTRLSSSQTSRSRDKIAKPLSPATTVKSKLSTENTVKPIQTAEKTQRLESTEKNSVKDKDIIPKKGTVRSFLKNKLLPSSTAKKQQKNPPPFSNSADKERLSPADYSRQQWTIEWASRQDKKRNNNPS